MSERTHMDFIREAWFAGKTIQINTAVATWSVLREQDCPNFQGSPENYRIKLKEEKPV